MPPRCEVREPWLYASNMRACSASGMPGPWSDTAKRTPVSVDVAVTATRSPAFVNFSALPTRFARICVTRSRSHSTVPVAVDSVARSTPAARAIPSN